MHMFVMILNSVAGRLSVKGPLVKLLSTLYDLNDHVLGKIALHIKTV